MPTSTDMTFFSYSLTLLSFYYPLSFPFPFSVFKDTSACPCEVSINSLLFQGLEVVPGNIRVRGKKGYFLQGETDRASSWVLGTADTRLRWKQHLTLCYKFF